MINLLYTGLTGRTNRTFENSSRLSKMQLLKEKSQRSQSHPRGMALAGLVTLLLSLAIGSIAPAFAQGAGGGTGGGTGGSASEQNLQSSAYVEQAYRLRNPEYAEFMRLKGSEKTANTPQQITNRFPYSIAPPIPPGMWQSQTPGEGGRYDVDTYTCTGGVLTDQAFAIHMNHGLSRLLEKQMAPERIMHAVTGTGGVAANNAANSEAGVVTNQAYSAIDYCKQFLTNFTAEPGNVWQDIRDHLFIPMAVLLLLPGAVLAQVRAIVAQGSPILVGEVHPLEGLLRSIVCIFLIPGTFLVINYGIDVANSLTYTVADEYRRLFGSDMYEDAKCAVQRAYPTNKPEDNRNAIDQDATPAASGGFSVFAVLERNTIAVALIDPCLGIYQSIMPDETVPQAVNIMRAMINNLAMTAALSWNVSCAFQMAYLYYLWCMGPIAAALWVWPVAKMKGALGSWCEGVIVVCFWSLFWNTIILLLACFKGVGFTGTMIVTALLMMAVSAVKSAFDFSGMVTDSIQSAATAAISAAQQANKGGGGKGGGGGGGGGQQTGGQQGTNQQAGGQTSSPASTASNVPDNAAGAGTVDSPAAIPQNTSGGNTSLEGAGSRSVSDGGSSGTDGSNPVADISMPPGESGMSGGDDASGMQTSLEGASGADIPSSGAASGNLTGQANQDGSGSQDQGLPPLAGGLDAGGMPSADGGAGMSGVGNTMSGSSNTDVSASNSIGLHTTGDKVLDQSGTINGTGNSTDANAGSTALGQGQQPGFSTADNASLSGTGLSFSSPGGSLTSGSVDGVPLTSASFGSTNGALNFGNTSAGSDFSTYMGTGADTGMSLANNQSINGDASAVPLTGGSDSITAAGFNASSANTAFERASLGDASTAQGTASDPRALANSIVNSSPDLASAAMSDPNGTTTYNGQQMTNAEAFRADTGVSASTLQSLQSGAPTSVADVAARAFGDSPAAERAGTISMDRPADAVAAQAMDMANHMSPEQRSLVQTAMNMDNPQAAMAAGQQLLANKPSAAGEFLNYVQARESGAVGGNYTSVADASSGFSGYSAASLTGSSSPQSIDSGVSASGLTTSGVSQNVGSPTYADAGTSGSAGAPSQNVGSPTYADAGTSGSAGAPNQNFSSPTYADAGTSGSAGAPTWGNATVSSTSVANESGSAPIQQASLESQRSIAADTATTSGFTPSSADPAQPVMYSQSGYTPLASSTGTSEQGAIRREPDFRQPDNQARDAGNRDFAQGHPSIGSHGESTGSAGHHGQQFADAGAHAPNSGGWERAEPKPQEGGNNWLASNNLPTDHSGHGAQGLNQAGFSTGVFEQRQGQQGYADRGEQRPDPSQQRSVQHGDIQQASWTPPVIIPSSNAGRDSRQQLASNNVAKDAAAKDVADKNATKEQQMAKADVGEGAEAVRSKEDAMKLTHNNKRVSGKTFNDVLKDLKKKKKEQNPDETDPNNVG
ncbi:MAG: hypothetical protein SFV17_24420 [Candidatus Obscuribacter sp.]|nr:hypothetical protein [Candidatus Obscuribacter sp.]